MGQRLFRLSCIALIATLTACGSAYISPDVPDDDPNVSVVPLTTAVISQANRSRYTPKSLPREFFTTVRGTGVLRSAGVLPAPSLERPVRPEQLQVRIPPNPPITPYRIGVGDVVLLATSAASNTIEELSGLLASQNRRQGYTVQDDGAIAIANVGRVPLAGLSLEEAQDEVFQALVSNQIDPSFSLEVSQFNSQRVSVGGAVSRPSIMPISLRPLELQEAIVKAGGVSAEDSEFATIRIYRDGEIYQIPLSRYLQDSDVQKLRLAAGDSVFVDSAFELSKAEAYFREQIALAQLKQQARTQALAQLDAELAQRRAELSEARTNFNARLEADAVDRDFVYMTGEVIKPGRFPLPFSRKASLADALFGEAGLDNETANPTQVYVLRGQSSSDQVTAYNLNFRNAANLVLATKMQLRPNDIIFVAEQPVTRWSRVIQQISPNLVTASVNAAN